jgi:branched-chain amino acid aminotransferase
MRKINFSNYAPFYKKGLRLHVPKLRRIPPKFLNPQYKNSSSYFTLSLAREEIWKFDRTANAILLDENSNINEGYGFNIFFIKGNKVFTPKSKYVLPGITREKVMQISKKLKFKVIEKNIQLKEIKKFDESFVTATGWGICPVKSINKKIFTNQKKTKQIQKNFGDIVKIDIVEQYLNFLND